MKRCFYIANSYDGSYFFVSDDIEEYFQKLAAYAMNLKNSQKLNHYSFGSVEMTEAEYEGHRDGAGKLESSQIKMREEQEKRQQELHEVSEDNGEEDKNPTPPRSRPHLRLV